LDDIELDFAARLLSSALEKPPPEMCVGNYVLLEPLEKADGATGEVWIARQLDADDLVAIKLAKRELMPHVELVFRQEHRNGRDLQDDNILRATEVGVHDGRPFLVMPLMRETLADCAADYREPTAALELMLKLLKGLGAAHQRTIMHCDLKPENILFDEKRNVRIGDFGLSRRIQASGSTQGEAWGGTRGYMSPEQVLQEPLTVASDLFSLGVILYQLLAGRLPFGSGPDFEHRVLHEVPPPPFPPRLLAGKLEWELAAICDRALQRHPGARYQSTDALTRDLECVLDGEPVQAEKHRRMRRAIKWVRSHWMAVVAAVEIVVLLACLPFIMDGTVAELRSNSRQQNEFSARAQARAVLGELTGLQLRVRAMAADPHVRALLEHADISTRSPALEVHAVGFDSVSVFAADGEHRARSPVGSLQLRQNCAFKDYFQCAKRIAESRGADQAAECVARAHRSWLDAKVKLGVAAPLVDEEGKFVGVVMASTKARERFGAIQMNCGAAQCWTALLGPRDRESPDAPFPDQLSILAQDGLLEGASIFLGAETSNEICENVGCVPRFDQPFDPRAAGSSVVLDPYVDPITGAKAIGVVTPVGGTGLSVLVATPDAAADALARRVRDSYRIALWPLALGLLAVVCFAVIPRRPWRGPEV
jgi:hypothetical protein